MFEELASRFFHMATSTSNKVTNNQLHHQQHIQQQHQQIQVQDHHHHQNNQNQNQNQIAFGMMQQSPSIPGGNYM